MLKKLLRPTNSRARLIVGLLLAGLFFIQCTRKVEGIREPVDIAAVSGHVVSVSKTSRTNTVEKLAKTSHIALLEYCLKNYETNYQNFTCTFVKQEVIRSVAKPEQHMKVKYMESPFSVAMEWVKNPPISDRILYVEGKYDNNMLVRPSSPLLRALAGTVKRKPTSPQVMKNTLRPVSMFGFKRGMENLLDVYRKAKKANDLTENFKGYMEVAGRKAIVIERVLPAKKDYSSNRTEIYIDAEYLVPVCIKAYDWNGKLNSKYIYKDINLNVKLSDQDFTPKANGMKNPK